MTFRKLSVNQQILLLGFILTFANLAMIIHKSSRVYLFQQTLCFNYYAIEDPARIDSDGSIDESLCKLGEIQAPLSVFDGVDSFLISLPALLVLATYKEFMAIVGLRRLVLLNICCSALGVLYSVANFSLHKTWTPNAILASCIFDLIGGGEMTRIIMVTTSIATISPPENLTNAYNYISGCWFLATVCGSAIGSFLLNDHVYLLNGLSIFCYILTICFTIAIPSHLGHDPHPNGDTRPILLDCEELESSPSSSPEREHHSISITKNHALTGILLDSWKSSYQSILTLFSVPNPTFTVLVIFFLNSLAIGLNVLLPQYTSLTLRWPLATVNRALALKALVSSLILFALPTLRKLYLEPRMGIQQIDLFITQTSLLANIIGIIGLGFSAPAAFFVLSLCVYTSGTGLADSLTAYGTFSLPQGLAVADFYVRTGLIQTIAALLGAPLWSAGFSFVIRSGFLPLGLPFWICAGLYAAGIVGIRVLRVSSFQVSPEPRYSAAAHSDVES